MGGQDPSYLPLKDSDAPEAVAVPAPTSSATCTAYAHASGTLSGLTGFSRKNSFNNDSHHNSGVPELPVRTSSRLSGLLSPAINQGSGSRRPSEVATSGGLSRRASAVAPLEDTDEKMATGLYSPMLGTTRPTSPMAGAAAAAELTGGRWVPLLTTLQLVGITFFAVTGGPYGFADAVGAGGAAITFLLLLVLPFVWCAPMAMMTSELACMIPESGGHILWVYRAFGPFWAFVNSCFGLLCTIFDSALYPVAFVEFMGTVFLGHDMPYAVGIVLKMGIICLVTLVNIRGISIVGSSSVVFGGAVLLPVVVMILMGLPSLNFKWIIHPIPSNISWGLVITKLLWNMSGFDAAGSVAAEVREPAHAYPRALGISILVVTLTYALPVLVGISVLPDITMWHEGAFARVAKAVGGRPLEVWLALAAALSAFGLLLTRMCTNARLVYGMSLIEQLPPVFCRVHPKYGTPWVAILITSACTVLLTGFQYTSLVEADMLFYALSTVMKFGALIQLRYAEEDAFRPYAVPLGNTALTVVMAVPIALCGAMVWLASPRAQAVGLAGSVCAVFAFMAKEGYKQFRVAIEERLEEHVYEVKDRLDGVKARFDTVFHKGRWQRLNDSPFRAAEGSSLDPLTGAGAVKTDVGSNILSSVLEETGRAPSDRGKAYSSSVEDHVTTLTRKTSWRESIDADFGRSRVQSI